MHLALRDHQVPTYQVIATNTGAPALPVQKAEARHRVHARVEDYIRCAKNTGLASPPSWSFAINQAWLSTMVRPRRDRL
jgi:hypothetical protein